MAVEKSLDEVLWRNIAIIRSRKDERYVRDVLEARRDFLRLRARHEPAIRKIYIDAADNVAKRLRELSPATGELTRKHLIALEKALREEAEKTQRAIEALVKDGMHQAASCGGRALENNLISAVNKSGAEDIINVFKLQRGFAEINSASVEALWSRTHKVLRVSDRIWKHSQDARDATRDIIQVGIAQGRDAVKVARDLEQYVRSGKKTLSQDYLNMMDRMGTRVPKDLSYESLRLVRSEYTKAFTEGVYSRGRINPSYTGVRWMLSGAHPIHDICDEFAEADLYDMGPGVYPKGEEPVNPHPNCLCYVVSNLKDTDEFVADLIKWRDDPSSTPYLEEWYNGTCRSMMEYPQRVKPQTKLERVIKEKESEIAKRKTEKAYVFDSDGNIILSKSGSKTSVKFILEEVEKMENNILMHNHPGGTSFSKQDIKSATSLGVSEIRVVGEKYAYSMKASSTWPSWDTGIEEIYNAIYAEVYAEQAQAIRRGEMTIDEANIEHMHTVWSRLAKRNPEFVYIRQRR